jgi:hypothetical protein
MCERISPKFIGLVLLYAIASLVHFVHNAEYLPEYPNLPATWTRDGVYLAWFGMTAIGLVGLSLAACGFQTLGLLIIVVYAALGVDSLGHYFVAPLSAHTAMMNLTILFEVSCAALLLVVGLTLLTKRIFSGPVPR